MTLYERRVVSSQIIGHSTASLTAYADPYKKTSKHALLTLCEGNSPVTDEFPAQRARNVEKASIDYVFMLIEYVTKKQTEKHWAFHVFVGGNDI